MYYIRVLWLFLSTFSFTAQQDFSFNFLIIIIFLHNFSLWIFFDFIINFLETFYILSQYIIIIAHRCIVFVIEITPFLKYFTM